MCAGHVLYIKVPGDMWLGLVCALTVAHTRDKLPRVEETDNFQNWSLEG